MGKIEEMEKTNSKVKKNPLSFHFTFQSYSWALPSRVVLEILQQHCPVRHMIKVVTYCHYPRIISVGRDLKTHQVPDPLPWTGTPSARLGCLKPHPILP